MKHKFKVIPKEEILNNRCNAYEFINFDKDMKQTAVDWLIEKMLNQDWYTYKSLEYIEQAKEMEKQQQGYSEEDMKEAFLDGWVERDGKLTFSKAIKKWFEEFKNK